MFVLALTATATLLVPLRGTAGDLQLVTTNDAAAGLRAGGGDSQNPILSRDGRFVLFASTAGNLTSTGSNCVSPPGTLPKLNVFLRDRTSGRTRLVSVNQAGTGGGDNDSVPVAISTNGQIALFESDATDLVTGDTNGVKDVFVRDVVAGTTTLISVNTNGSVGNGASWQSAMTPDGRYIAFSSAARDLGDSDTNGIADIFVRDLQTGITVLASPGAVTGSIVPCSSDSPQITPDGRYVAFLSSAVQLVPGYMTPNEIYVRDLVAGKTSVVSTNAHQSLSGATVSYNHAISDDGTYVAFEASLSSSASFGLIFRYYTGAGTAQVLATNAVAVSSGNTGFRHFRSLDITPDGGWITFVGKTNGTSQAYAWDGQSGATTVVSQDLAGNPAPIGFCDFPVIDDTGRYVAFRCSATNLTTNVVAEGFHLYVRDLQENATRLVDEVGTGFGSAKDFLSLPAVAAGVVAFDCTDTDLVNGDNNEARDIFLRDLGSGAIELVSARDATMPSRTPPGLAMGPVISASADGRHIAFSSVAGELIPGCTNEYRAVFVRDLLYGSNILVSVDTNGSAGLDRNATDPSISADGRFVAFSSGADNLIPGDANKLQDVFLRDLQNQVTMLVSVASNGVSPGNGISGLPVVSADGSVVMFRSRANNLAPGSWSSVYDNLFVRKQGVTYTLAPGGVTCAAMSPDGRWVAFGGGTGNMFLWDTFSNARVDTNTTLALSSIAVSDDGSRLAGLRGSQVYVADRRAGSNYLLVASTAQTTVSHASLQFSADGRFLVFCTGEPLISYDTNGLADIYLYDFVLRIPTLVSRTYDSPWVANGPSDSPVVSADGRFIAWRSFASNLVSVDLNGAPDVFLHDMQTGVTIPLSTSAAVFGTADNRSLAPVFTPDGRTLIFQSWGSDLVTGDFNQGADIFALRLAAPPDITPFPMQIIYAPASTQPLRLTWPAVSGAVYRVEYKSDLREVDWLDLNVPITVFDNQGYATDLSAPPGQRFYRIRAFPGP
jgi:Tol biopolymer transport system component